MRNILLKTTIIICLFVTSCSVNPATGRKQLTGLLSDDKAYDIGLREHPKILKTYGGIYNIKGLTNYVNEVGQKIVAVSDMPETDFKFVVLNKNMVNAFAMPGGYIYIGRGILELANDEAELAGVLAHEIGHITARHSQSRYTKDLIMGLGSGIIDEYLGSGTGTILEIGGDMYLMSYSRNQEYQADLLSVKYLAKAGYDPNGILRFMSSLKENGILDAKLKNEDVSKNEETGYFDTHPNINDRISEIRITAMREKYGVKNKNEYLDKIDGMIYGQLAEQGFVRGQKFFHPDLGISFEFPKNFDITNLDSAVVGQNNKKQITFTIDQVRGMTNPVDYLKDIWLANLQRSKGYIDTSSIQGMYGAKSSYYNGDLKVTLLALYNPNNSLFYKFTFINTQNFDIKDIEESIHLLTSKDLDKYREYKVKVITVQEGDTVDKLAERLPFTDLKRERFLMLNGLGKNYDLLPGQRVKIIE